MSATTASERAHELVREISSAAMSVVAPGGSKAGLDYADAAAALLDYIAALEACVAAAEPWQDPKNCGAFELEPLIAAFAALAALDAPATEETK